MGATQSFAASACRGSHRCSGDSTRPTKSAGGTAAASKLGPRRAARFVRNVVNAGLSKIAR
jgi:hypothetical protein